MKDNNIYTSAFPNVERAYPNHVILGIIQTWKYGHGWQPQTSAEISEGIYRQIERLQAAGITKAQLLLKAPSGETVEPDYAISELVPNEQAKLAYIAPRPIANDIIPTPDSYRINFLLEIKNECRKYNIAVREGATPMIVKLCCIIDGEFWMQELNIFSLMDALKNAATSEAVKLMICKAIEERNYFFETKRPKFDTPKGLSLSIAKIIEKELKYIASPEIKYDILTCITDEISRIKGDLLQQYGAWWER